MARGVPDEEVYQPRVPVEDLPRKITPHAEAQDFGAPVAQGVQVFANALEQKNQADSATWASDQIAQARISAVQSLEQAKAQAPPGDQTGFTNKFLAGFDKGTAPLVESAGSNLVASKMVQKGLTNLRQTLQEHTSGWEAEQNVAYRGDSLQNNLKGQLPIIEAHPELAGQVGSTLMDQLNATGIEPGKRLAVAREMDSQISLAAANGLTRQDPRGALQALNDPEKASATFKPVLTGLNDAQREAVRAKANEHLGDTVYAALDSGNTRQAQIALSKNEDLLDPKTAHQLQSTINQTSEHNILLNDKLQRDASNSLLKNAIKMSMDGTLTPQYIEQHHNTWEPAAYEYAYGLLSGKKTETDVHTYVPLLQAALSGQDKSDEIRDGMYSGKISLSDGKQLLEQTEKPRKGYVARGADYIAQSLKPNPLVSDPAGARSAANALDDWRQATEDHPEMSEEQARTLYKNITDHYQVVSSDKATVFMPVPLQLVGSRMQPDIPNTWLATKKAHDAGEMSDAEYQRQAALIMQWKTATDKRTPPKAPAP